MSATEDKDALITYVEHELKLKWRDVVGDPERIYISDESKCSQLKIRFTRPWNEIEEQINYWLKSIYKNEEVVIEEEEPDRFDDDGDDSWVHDSDMGSQG